MFYGNKGRRLQHFSCMPGMPLAGNAALQTFVAQYFVREDGLNKGRKAR